MIPFSEEGRADKSKKKERKEGGRGGGVGGEISGPGEYFGYGATRLSTKCRGYFW